MNRIRYFLAILLSLYTIYNAAASNPKREFRGVWVATVWGIDWPSQSGTSTAVQKKQKAEMAALLDRCQAMNLTTVCFQVRSMGDVMFQSEIEPWSAFVSGKRGVTPGWDVLEFVVNECHKRGLECYAWVNPFRWSTGTNYSTQEDLTWMTSGWLLTHGKYTVFNPGIEEVRQHVVALCREIVTGYAVDGLIFDDYFYPNKIPETDDAPDYELYRTEAPWMSFGDWRRANVHKAVADVYAMIEDERPDVVFGISPAGVAGKGDTSAAKWGMEPCAVKASDWQYNEIYSDPLGLMYQHTVDFISPQIYWHTDHATAPYEPIAKWWSEAANLYGRHFYGSVTMEHIAKADTKANREQILTQVEHNRQLSIDGTTGTLIYSAKYLPKIERELGNDAFSTPSLAPVMEWKQRNEYPSPKGVKLHDGKLKWDAVTPHGRENIRYTVYAIPVDVTPEDAMDEFGDGISGEYLVGVTYLPEKSVPVGGYRYAVCTYSAGSVESAPAFLK